jgi:hypothetical protein
MTLMMDHPLVVDDVLSQAFTYPLVALKTIQSFKVPGLDTPVIDRIDLSNVVGWQKIEALLPQLRR